MAYLLQELLADAAGRFPDRTAIHDGGQRVTYEQLDRLSNQLARELQVQGVARGDRVGILLRKSAASVVGAFAALKAGACYVPLDTNSPDERLALLVKDSGVRAVLADDATVERAMKIGGEARPGLCVIVVRAAERTDIAEDPRADRGVSEPAAVSWASVLAQSDEPLEAVAAIDTDLAYMLYTSGSTGAPKGVLISHRASLTFVEWATDCVRLREQDRVCSPAPLHFDLSVFDIFASCRAGACMVVLPAMTAMFPVRLASWIEQEQISVWYSVPSVLTMLVTHGNLGAIDLSGLRTLIFAGEVFPAKYLSMLRERVPGARYLNWYGPTETNVCTWYEVAQYSPAPSTPVPIGRAITNVDVFAITDAGRRATRAGEEGELFVRGSGLMTGYWGQPEKSADALVSNPLQDAYDEPVYRTGDIVTLDERGNYVFIGRRDAMVKTRGYRVELGEVEAALYRHPSVREAAVLPVPDELLGSSLRAVVCVDGEAELVRDELLGHCRRVLPSYMVPDVVEFRQTLPKTSTGKIDRIRLQAP